MDIPTFKDVLQARQVVYQHVSRTPLHHYPALSALVGAEVYLKHENHHARGSFKVRGGVNFMTHLSPEERKRGVITSSTGNHGQSIAYAGRAFGVKAVVVVPEGSNPNKLEAMRNLDAEVIVHGSMFDESRAHAEMLTREMGYRYVHAANEPLLIAGVATYTLEVFEDLPQVDYLFVPLGGGSGASGACIVAKTLNPSTQVIAVQSEAAPAGYLSWKGGRLVEAEMSTFAEGLATSTAYELPQSIIQDLLDDFLLVSDDEIKEAIVHLLQRAHTLAEGAGATALAGAIKARDRLAGKKVAVVVSGGNITVQQLSGILRETQVA